MNQPAEYRPASAAQNNQTTTLALLKRLTPEIERALPKGMDADRIARLVMTEIRKNPQLADCTQMSFSGALLNASALGLEPGVGGEAYLVPYKNKGTLECQLIVGYQGVVKLFWQHPRAQGIRTETVYSNDTITEYTKGTGGKFTYTPTLGDRGEIVAYYAEVAIAGVRDPLWGVFTPDEIKALRNGKTGGNGNIADPQRWMERKTALKQVLKLAPKTTRLDMAIRLDDAAISGASQPKIDMAALTSAPEPAPYIEGEYDESPPPPAEPPPADVVYASTEQVARLKQVRSAEKLDGDGWRDFVLASGAGVEVYESDDKLTKDQAQHVLDVFNGDAK